MDRFSPLTTMTLERLMGNQALAGTSVPNMTVGRILVVVEGPEELAAEMIARAMETDARVRRANRRLARRDPMAPGVDAQGHFTINGRTCCWAHVQNLSKAIDRLPLLSEHACKTCGTIYRVDVGRTA